MAFGDLKGTFTAAANSITNPTNAALSTGSGAVKAGDLVYVVVGEQTALTATAVTDNLGNSYGSTQAGVDAGTSTGIAFFSRVTVAGTITSISVAATGSADNAAIVAGLFEGPFAVSPLSANPTNITSDVTSPFTCPATGTLAAAMQLVVSWGVATGSTVWAATAPNTLADQIATQAVLHTVLGYQAVNATTTLSPAFTAASNPTDAVLGTSSFNRDLLIAQYDWPVPKGYAGRSSDLRTFVNPVGINLIGKDQFFGAAGQARVYNWPVPPGQAGRSSDLRTIASPFNPNLLGAAVTYLPAAIAEQITPWGSARPVDLLTFISANNPNLQTPAPAPFVPIDWVNPTAAKSSAEQRTFLNRSAIHLIGQDQFFGAPGQAPLNSDQPNPRGAARSIELRTWTQGFQAQLQDTTTYLPAGVTAGFNPWSATFPIGLRGFVGQFRAQLDAIAAALPPGKAEWSNPGAASRSIELRSHLQGINPNLIGQDRFFGAPGQAPANTDWPNPRGLKRGVSFVAGVPVSLATAAAAVVYMPAGVTGWSNPSGSPRGANSIYTITRSGVPFDNYVLRLPLFSRQRHRDATVAISAQDWVKQNTLPQMLARPVGTASFDARLPAFAPRAIALRTWTQGFQAQLQDATTYLPAGVTAGFNPWSAAFPISLRGFVGQFRAHLSVVATMPPANYDWPVPGQPRAAIALRTFTAPLKLNLLGQDTMFGAPGQVPAYDWPVPRGSVSAVNRLGQVTGFCGNLTVAIPATNYDWPVPRQPRGAIGLRTFTDPLKLNLLGQDTMFGAPGQVPSRDWPNPRGAIVSTAVHGFIQRGARQIPTNANGVFVSIVAVAVERLRADVDVGQPSAGVTVNRRQRGGVTITDRVIT